MFVRGRPVLELPAARLDEPVTGRADLDAGQGTP
jgi:hypothetical protein